MPLECVSSSSGMWEKQPLPGSWVSSLIVHQQDHQHKLAGHWPIASSSGGHGQALKNSMGRSIMTSVSHVMVKNWRLP